MIKFFCSLILLSYFICQSGWAEQSLFNVPSSEITTEDHLFFQEQLNITHFEFQSNSVFCYGIGHGLEIGFNITSLSSATNSDDTSHSLAPLFVLEVQKDIPVSEAFHIGVGSLFGTNPFKGAHQWNLAQFSFINLVYEYKKIGVVFYLGGYFGNQAYLGRKDMANFMAGLEWKILPEKLHWITDHIHGYHDLGVTVSGPAWYITPSKVLSLGLQIPNATSQSPLGFVVEFTAL